MPKTFVSPFPQNPRTATAVATAAIALTGANSLATDTAAGTVLLATAGADGALLTRLTAIPRGTVTATTLPLFIRRASEPAANRMLIDSAVMPAQTVNGTVQVIPTVFSLYNEGTPLRMGPGDELYVGATVALAAGIAFRAELTDF